MLFVFLDMKSLMLPAAGVFRGLALWGCLCSVSKSLERRGRCKRVWVYTGVCECRCE